MTNDNFLNFKNEIDQKINSHPSIANNLYTLWFSSGCQTQKDMEDFIIQYSIFSNDLNHALMCKMISAKTRESMRQTKELLMNELGVIYKPSGTEYDPENMENLGSVDGGRFRFSAGHYEWLADTGEAIGLRYDQFGRTNQGNEESQEFSKIMIDLYKSDYSDSDGANYALEHWAASGFWLELIDGFNKFGKKHNKKIPIGFFTYHYKIESQHKKHTETSLKQIFYDKNFNQEDFINGAIKILDGLHLFWIGLQKPILQRSEAMLCKV
jgi:pyrroloquinoline quinone (PQQ) biosynthesis protein C